MNEQPKEPQVPATKLPAAGGQRAAVVQLALGLDATLGPFNGVRSRWVGAWADWLYGDDGAGRGEAGDVGSGRAGATGATDQGAA